MRQRLAALAIVLALSWSATALAQSFPAGQPPVSPWVSGVLYDPATGLPYKAGGGGGGSSQLQLFNGSTWDNWLDSVLPGAANVAMPAGSVVSGAYLSGAFAVGAGVDGWNVTEGAKADSAAVSGANCSLVACLKSIRDAALSTANSAVINGPTAGTTTGTTSAATITNASTQFVAAGARTLLAVDNESVSATIACRFGATAALNTAGSFTIGPAATRTWNSYPVPTEAMNCISSVASSPATIEVF